MIIHAVVVRLRTHQVWEGYPWHIVAAASKCIGDVPRSYKEMVKNALMLCSVRRIPLCYGFYYEAPGAGRALGTWEKGCTRFLVLGTRNIVFGTWYCATRQVPSTSHLVPDARCLALSDMYLVSGAIPRTLVVPEIAVFNVFEMTKDTLRFRVGRPLPSTLSLTILADDVASFLAAGSCDHALVVLRCLRSSTM